MTTTTKDIISPKVLDGKHSIVGVLREGWMKQHVQIVIDAKAAQLKAVRDDACEAFGVTCEETDDGEGSGSVQLIFPDTWNTDQATYFAVHMLDLDLGRRDGGPGRYFQDSDIADYVDGRVGIYVRWGLDI